MLNISCPCYQLLSISQIKEQERNIICKLFSRRRRRVKQAAKNNSPGVASVLCVASNLMEVSARFHYTIQKENDSNINKYAYSTSRQHNSSVRTTSMGLTEERIWNMKIVLTYPAYCLGCDDFAKLELPFEIEANSEAEFKFRRICCHTPEISWLWREMSDDLVLESVSIAQSRELCREVLLISKKNAVLRRSSACLFLLL